MRIVVVSTGNAPRTKQLCMGSVARQIVSPGVKVFHIPIDAAEQPEPKTCAENLYNAISGHRFIQPTDIVAWLDLDDWLATDHALSKIASIYDDPSVWVTYGSYRHADGRPGICAPYENENYRIAPWRASHLKTFRAWLFRRIQPEHLFGPDGHWLSRAVDHAVMFPLLEMAGAKHSRHVPDILVTYNYATSFEHNATREEITEEQGIAQWIRARMRYERVEGP